MTSPKFILPFSDYERMFRLIFSVMDQKMDPANSSLFFSFAGASILKEKYKLNAKPVAGSAAYVVRSESEYGSAKIKAFGQWAQGQLLSGESFHSWIEVEGTVIDLMAPLFQETMLTPTQIPRKMFQKPRREGVVKVLELERAAEGAFFLSQNPALEIDLFKSFFEDQMCVDLLGICLDWYQRPPKKLKEYSIQDAGREAHAFTLRGPQLIGVW